VRLWLDDFTVMSKLRREVDPAYDIARVEGVEIARLREPFVAGETADVVVETFGCDPPEGYVLDMAGRTPKPRWINLEYLSAEAWIEASHALPSPSPRLPLTKHYFFPGFTPRTGGLLREADLLARRDAFQADARAQAAFWKALVGRAPPEGALKVSLFGYADAPFDSLVRSCEHLPGPVWLVAPEGVAATALRARVDAVPAGTRNNAKDGGRRREIAVFTVPFLPQDQYDELLWACDVNFVRGEDSFVRAQWAARPFVWNIYPTEDGAHWVKLSAFLARFTAGLDRVHAAVLTALWETWNRPRESESGDNTGPGMAQAWPAFIARRSTFEAHALDWCATLATRRDLAAELVDFADNVLK
jgi:uncharacterized repeat protein (TIGR03837 family)